MNLKITIPPMKIELDKKLIKAALRSAGSEIATTAKNLIKNAVGDGRTVKGIASSAPGNAPVSRSGVLASSITSTVNRSGSKVSIKDSAGYALEVETGSVGGSGKKGSKNTWLKGKLVKASSIRVQLPRPFLEIALDSRRDSIQSRLEQALINGTKFVRKGKTP